MKEVDREIETLESQVEEGWVNDRADSGLDEGLHTKNNTADQQAQCTCQ